MIASDFPVRHVMSQSELLIENIEKLHTTAMGADRIKRNLKSGTDDVVGYCRESILNQNCRITRQGKNWYCKTENIRITVNAYSHTIITAHIMDEATERRMR